MRIIVSDSSALIDLKKGGLLRPFLRLPFELVVPDTMLANELLSFTQSEHAAMRRAMTVVTLDSAQVARALDVQHSSPALTVYDCAAFVIAQASSDSILLTGDRRMREKACAAGMECHGILWIVDEIDKAELAPAKTLLQALEIWRADVLVRLPATDLDSLIARFKKR